MAVSFDNFAQLDIRVGRIVEVNEIPRAKKPMYKFRIDFGTEGVRQCVAGVKPFYTMDQLQGKLVVAVVNLAPRPIAGVLSECMVLASFSDTQLSLLVPDKEMPLGTKVA
jgi:tRNA-binding protein